MTLSNRSESRRGIVRLDSTYGMPWVVHPISLSELLWNLACLMTLSTLLIVLPVCFLRLVVRRQFSLKTLLGFPIVAILFLLAMFMDVPIAEDVHTFGERLAMAIIYAPLVGSIGFVVWWIVGRRYTLARCGHLSPHALRRILSLSRMAIDWVDWNVRNRLALAIDLRWHAPAGVDQESLSVTLEVQ